MSICRYFFIFWLKKAFSASFCSTLLRRNFITYTLESCSEIGISAFSLVVDDCHRLPRYGSFYLLHAFHKANILLYSATILHISTIVSVAFSIDGIGTNSKRP